MAWDRALRQQVRVVETVRTLPLVQPIVWIAPQTSPALQEQILRHVRNAEEFVASRQTSTFQGSRQQIPRKLQIEEGELWSDSRVDTWETFLQDRLPVPVELVVKTERQSVECSCKLQSESDVGVEHSPDCTCACPYCNKQRACSCVLHKCECPVLCNCVCMKCKHVVVSELSWCTDADPRTNESLRTPPLCGRNKSLLSSVALRADLRAPVTLLSRGAMLGRPPRPPPLPLGLRAPAMLLPRGATQGLPPLPPPRRPPPPLSLHRGDRRLLDLPLSGEPRGRLPQLPLPQLQTHRRPQRHLRPLPGRLRSPWPHCQFSWVRRQLHPQSAPSAAAKSKPRFRATFARTVERGRR